MKRIFLILFVFFTNLSTNSQEITKNNKNFFIGVDFNGGYNLSKELGELKTKEAILNLGFTFSKRIDYNKNISLGIMYSDLLAQVVKEFQTDGSYHLTTYEIPLTFTYFFPNGGDNKTNRVLRGNGIYIELGGYYSFNNQVNLKDNDFLGSNLKGNSLGVKLRIGAAAYDLAFGGFYLELKKDLTPFIQDFDNDFKRFSIGLGYNIMLFKL